MENINKILLLENLLKKEIKKYSNLEVSELKNNLDIKDNPKNINRVIFDKMIKLSDDSSKITGLLKECNCVVKTVNLEWNDSLKESMSLNSFKFVDIAKEDWDNSTLKSYFYNHSFVFIVFKKTLHSSTLQDIKIWHMPERILNTGIKEVWEKTKDLIRQGEIVHYVDAKGRYVTYFPSSTDSPYIHVRPHAQNAKDTYPLPVPDKFTGFVNYTKQSFWLNKNFILKIIIDGRYYE